MKYCNLKLVIKKFYQLEGNRNLSEEEREEVTKLAVMWDLPGFAEHHQKWLFNMMLQLAVSVLIF